MSASAFWEWSLERYPRAKAPLLALQDSFGFNVNVLLWCAWRAERGAPADRDALAAALAAIAPWHEDVTRPARALRRRLRAFGPDGAAILPRAAALEIEAERVEQELLERASTPPTDQSTQRNGAHLDRVRQAALAYFADYAALAGAERNAEYSAPFGALADALFGS